MTHSPGTDGRPSDISQRHVDATVQHIEHGLKHGLGNDSVYHEIDSLRKTDTVNSKLNSNQFRHEIQQVDGKLHHDGFLPKVHIVLDENGATQLMPGTVDAGRQQTRKPENGQGHGHSHDHEKEAAHVHQQTHPTPHHRDTSGGHNGRFGSRSSDKVATNQAAQSIAANQGDDSSSANNDGGLGARPSDNPGMVPVDNLPDSQLTLSGAPTITPEKINLVLQQYHSPAAGMGQYIYDQGLKYGINPAMALAFYVVESHAGTSGLAAKNNSWGNVRGHGYLGYKPFDSIKESLDQWYDLMQRKYQGQFHADKLGQVIPHYAPDKDGNNEAVYIADVGQLVRKWASQS